MILEFGKYKFNLNKNKKYLFNCAPYEGNPYSGVDYGYGMSKHEESNSPNSRYGKIIYPLNNVGWIILRGTRLMY